MAMILVGMPDSPYVRRCEVSFKLMGVPYEREYVSVFRHMERFRQINPIIKAPTLVCEDGTVLMDSTLILDYADTVLAPARALMPKGGRERVEALRLIGIALAATDKAVSMVYEKNQRPAERRHEPWLQRVTVQANTGYGMLDEAVRKARPWLQGERLTAADVAVAVAWRFSQYYNAAETPAAQFPNLVAYSQRAEALPEFSSTPLDEPE
jgi:glutathione S-transferase